MLPVRLGLVPFFATCLGPLSMASSRRARQIVGGVSRPESRVQVSQTTKQVVVQCFGLTTDHKSSPSSRLRQSPPQSQQMYCFHARRPTCYGNLSVTKLKVIIVFYYILPRAEDDADVLYRPPNTYLG
jgi:hypothetical protein